MKIIIKIIMNILYGIGILIVLVIPLSPILAGEGLIILDYWQKNVEPYLPFENYYIDDFNGAVLMDKKMQKVIENKVFCSKKIGNTLYVLGHYGFFVADNNKDVIRMYPVSGVTSAPIFVIEEYKKQYQEKYNVDNINILYSYNELTLKEQKVLHELLLFDKSSKEELKRLEIDVYV